MTIPLLPIAPLTILQADHAGKVTSEERISWSAHSGEWYRTQLPASVIHWHSSPIFPFKNCHSWGESSEFVLGHVVVQVLSCFRLFAIPWTAARQVSLSFTISQSLLKLMSMELIIPSNHLILCHPLSLPLISPSLKIFSMNPPYPQSVSFSDFSFLLTLVSQIIDFQWWAAELEFHDTSSWAREVTLACVICVQVHTMC